MKIGFTGSQKGMTEFQLKEVELILISNERSVTEVHHGGCIGADELFHQLCLKLGLPIPIVHPASDVSPLKWAHLPVATYRLALPALKRNRDIVDSSDLMIATPSQNHEVLRSGTWATIRYAKSIGKVIHVIYPGK